MVKESITLLASFATIKALSDAKKYQSSYQILAEFIRDIIVEESVYLFQAIEMKNRLNNRFGFDIPEAVVKTSLRKISGISLDNGSYTVSISELKTDSLFKEKLREVDDTNKDIFDLLTDYIKERESKTVNVEVLTQDLLAFLMDEQHDAQGKYTDYIGEFILKNESNPTIQDGLTRIREGSILYIGLSNSISETGSITKPLTLYLGTEILFSLAGYNGEIYSQLAQDFFNQVKTANNSQAKIRLYYFTDVKNEIDAYFYAAEKIIEGKESKYLNRPAMAAITNGCSTAADVRIKQSDFYHNLEFGFGIREDPENNYYDETMFKTNLESSDYIDDEDISKKREAGIKYVSHINKLRGGSSYANDLDSRYLLVTNAKTTLLISKEQAEMIKAREKVDYVSDFAVSLDRITSLLWYKLGKGFGNSGFPKSVSAALKARIVLSTSIAKNADNAFSDIKNQYKNGTITDEQLAARIITLKNKPMLPEELQGDCIDEIMDFSPDFLTRYEEKVNSDRKALQEKEALIKELKREKETTITEKNRVIEEQSGIIAEQDRVLTEKDATIIQQGEAIKAQASESEKLQKELDMYRNKEAAENQKRNRRKLIFRKAKKTVLALMITAIIVLISVLFCNRVKPQITNAISISLGAIGIIISIVLFIKASKKDEGPNQ